MSPAGNNVLIVAEDPFFAQALQSQLESFCLCSIKNAHTLSASILLINRPQLILLHIASDEFAWHPRIAKLLTSIRESGTPFVVLSSLTDEDVEYRCWSLGALDYERLPLSMALLANRIKIHLERIAEQSRMRLMAYSDSLTGCHNRHYFLEQLPRLIATYAQDSSMLACALIDIDDFKSYNDLYGHAQGDKCLQSVAGLISGMTERQAFQLIRFGGEEFLIVMVSTSETETKAFFEAVIEKVMAERIIHAGSYSQCISISCGVAMSNQLTHVNLQNLIDEADKNLFISKRSGKNRASFSMVPI